MMRRSDRGEGTGSMDSAQEQKSGPQAAREEHGALGELIETERAVAAQLAAARQEASRLLEAAREDVRSTEARFDEAFDEALSRRRAALEDACEASCRAAEADAEAEVARYRQVDSAALDELGQWVAARIAGGEAST